MGKLLTRRLTQRPCHDSAMRPSWGVRFSAMSSRASTLSRETSRSRTARAGVTATATGHDTLTATDDFFSYRRNTLQGVRDYGRGLSAIALQA